MKMLLYTQHTSIEIFFAQMRYQVSFFFNRENGNKKGRKGGLHKQRKDVYLMSPRFVAYVFVFFGGGGGGVESKYLFESFTQWSLYQCCAN